MRQEGFIILYVKYRFYRINDLPDDNGSNNDGISQLIVDLLLVISPES